MAENDARIAKLRHLLAQLKGGKHVQNREMRKALGDSAYADFESAWREQLELRKQLKDKPDEIRDYETALKRAIFLESRARASRAGSQGASKLERATETAFEQLYEKLNEIIVVDGALRGWFDREVRLDAANFPDLSSIDAPRVVTASSGGGYASGIRGKRETKIAVIQHEIEQFGNAAADDDVAQAAQARLAKLRTHKS